MARSRSRTRSPQARRSSEPPADARRQRRRRRKSGENTRGVLRSRPRSASGGAAVPDRSRSINRSPPARSPQRSPPARSGQRSPPRRKRRSPKRGDKSRDRSRQQAKSRSRSGQRRRSRRRPCSRSRSGGRKQPRSRSGSRVRRPGARGSKPEGCRTIWVGWTEVKPDEKDLQEWFQDCGKITEVRCSEKHVRGYFAHVTFENTRCVDDAMRKTNSDFNGTRIQIDYAYMDKVADNARLAAEAPTSRRYRPKSVKPPNGHTLWVGDVSIDASEQDLIDLFEKAGPVEMICLQVNQLRNGKFGHVKFVDTEAVDKAAELAGTPVKGVPIRLDFAEDKPLAAYRVGKDRAVPESTKPEGCRTVWVGGLPAEVEEADVRTAFEKCGQILEIRLDKSKRSGTLFCHVEFADSMSVDKAVRMSGERVASSKIRVDFAENRKTDQDGPIKGGGKGMGKGGAMPFLPGMPPPFGIPGMPPPGMQGMPGMPPVWMGPGPPPPGFLPHMPHGHPAFMGMLPGMRPMGPPPGMMPGMLPLGGCGGTHPAALTGGPPGVLAAAGQAKGKPSVAPDSGEPKEGDGPPGSFVMNGPPRPRGPPVAGGPPGAGPPPPGPPPPGAPPPGYPPLRPPPGYGPPDPHYDYYGPYGPPRPPGPGYGPPPPDFHFDPRYHDFRHRPPGPEGYYPPPPGHYGPPPGHPGYGPPPGWRPPHRPDPGPPPGSAPGGKGAPPGAGAAPGKKSRGAGGARSRSGSSYSSYSYSYSASPSPTRR
ncbi:unnamed protein product, partial [Polarella glacialis]